MAKPWLNVPLADYEGHMSAPGVDQLAPLAEMFAEALDHSRPESVAILGIAGGNGLAAINPQITRRIAGIDFNPIYLEAAARRYPNLPGLELHCADLAEEPLSCAPVHLVHAALVFEHAGTGRCLDNAVALVASGGHLSVVLQLPSQVEQGVSSTGFASLQTLKQNFQFVEPTWLESSLLARGFTLSRQSRRDLPAGKAFWLGIFAQHRQP